MGKYGSCCVEKLLLFVFLCSVFPFACDAGDILGEIVDEAPPPPMWFNSPPSGGCRNLESQLRAGKLPKGSQSLVEGILCVGSRKPTKTTVDAVVNAMQSDPSCRKTQWAGCSAFHDFAIASNSPFFKTYSNSLDAIKAAIMTHYKDAEVITGCMQAIRYFARSEDDYKEIKKNDGVELVTAVMRRHRSNAEMQEACTGSLWNLAFHTDSRKLIQASGGVDEIIIAMRDHLFSPQVQLAGCCALQNLALTIEFGSE